MVRAASLRPCFPPARPGASAGLPRSGGVDLAAAWRALALDPHGGRIDVLVDRAFPGYQRGLVIAPPTLVAVPVGRTPTSSCGRRPWPRDCR